MRMMEEASRRRFDVVLVWALDRFTREGVSETFQHIARLKSYGVEFESYTEAHFRTTGPAGELMIAVAAWIAKQERVRMSERIKAGLDVARSKNKRLGNPPLPDATREAILSMRGQASVRKIAAKLDVSKSVVQKVLSTKGVPIVASALDETRVAL
jgi:DNA invertase Pin-like site-specific DNA recombinase